VHVTGPEDSPPLLLLPSKGGSGTVWLDLLPAVSQTHRTYLVDTLGELGRSVPTRMPARRADVTAWLESLLDEAGIERCTLVGMSMGAFLAATYALDRPDRVERLALLSPAAVISTIRPSWWRTAIPAVLSTDRARIEEFLRSHFVTESLSPASAASLEQTVVGMVGTRNALREIMPRRYRPTALASLTMPVLLVVGEEEILYDGPRAAGHLRRTLPLAQVEVLSDCGHLITIDQPERLAALLQDFLARALDSPKP
jgi:pimeloyl-ACP methyl ester carboxylesterase